MLKQFQPGLCFLTLSWHIYSRKLLPNTINNSHQVTSFQNTNLCILTNVFLFMHNHRIIIKLFVQNQKNVYQLARFNCSNLHQVAFSASIKTSQKFLNLQYLETHKLVPFCLFFQCWNSDKFCRGPSNKHPMKFHSYWSCGFRKED